MERDILHINLLLHHLLSFPMIILFIVTCSLPVDKERYLHLNAKYQKTARRNKKAFLSDQCKEIEGNNRMRNTRDLFKKIRDFKGIFQAKMGSIKDRNDMDLTEGEDIKKR